MASGAPERLRRLGIIKDEFDTNFVQTPNVRLETSNDGLESFASETRSAEPRLRSLLVVANRYPRVAVVVIAAVMLVGGVLTINALFGSAAQPVDPSADSAPATISDVPAGEVPDGGGLTSSADITTTPRASAATPTSEDLVVGSPRSTTEGVNPLGDSETPASVPQAGTGDSTLPDGTPGPAAIVDERIYSAEDVDVVPPRTSETLPGPTINAWTTRTNLLELIVSASGTVERATFVMPPQRMPDVLELGRTKVWKFTPAMKDGRPVRYRLLLRWEVNP